jgi:hypothetical protein
MTSTTSELAKQYCDSQKLAARTRIKSKYTIAGVGWFPWIARQLPLQAGDRVLDIGCGPGWFWEAVVSVLPMKHRETRGRRGQQRAICCMTAPPAVVKPLYRLPASCSVGRRGCQAGAPPNAAWPAPRSG